MKFKSLSILIIPFLLLCLFTPVMAGPDDDTGSVYDYQINSVIETGPGEVTVNVQARYCPYCNPNISGGAGHDAFGEGNGSGHTSCPLGFPDGTYIAARVKNSSGTVLDTQKIVLQQGVNFTLDTIGNWNFVFSNLPVSAGDTLTVEVDTYCSYCGHWYPTPQDVTVSASNSHVTYTGETIGRDGTSVNVSAILIDNDTGDPLVGETITFTLDSLTPVNATTDSNGIASTTYNIPAGTVADIYPMTARFNGNISYFPHSDVVNFEVFNNHPPIAAVNGPYLTPVNSPITVDGTESSDPDGDFLIFDWNWGDSTTSTDAGPTPNHTYAEAGIYDICLTVDDSDLSDTTCTFAVVYDPSAGFVTGGGWIDSQAGSYKLDQSLTGKANFGFVSKYKKGANTPTGHTEFQFQTASVNFNSNSYEWLVINQGGTNAQFKGEGTINNGYDPNGNLFKFMIWATDDSVDTFRIKIWWEDDTEHLIYDNGSDQEISGGQIVIHTAKK